MMNGIIIKKVIGESETTETTATTIDETAFDDMGEISLGDIESTETTTSYEEEISSSEDIGFGSSTASCFSSDRRKKEEEEEEGRRRSSSSTTAIYSSIVKEHVDVCPFDKYEILDFLGSGASGRVMKVRIKPGYSKKRSAPRLLAADNYSTREKMEDFVVVKETSNEAAKVQETNDDNDKEKDLMPMDDNHNITVALTDDNDPSATTAALFLWLERRRQNRRLQQRIRRQSRGARKEPSGWKSSFKIPFLNNASRGITTRGRVGKAACCMVLPSRTTTTPDEGRNLRIDKPERRQTTPPSMKFFCERGELY